MKESFFRTGMLLGESAEAVLAHSKVIVFGVGGVGGHCIDALARCGVGNLIAVDSASVKASNLNRQICAKKSTIGMRKVDVMQMHVHDVSDCSFTGICEFVTAENASRFIPDDSDIVIDAVDNVTAKLAIIEHSKKVGIPVLSSMGAGNRLDPTAIRIADIYSTSIDPLSRVMRRELRSRKVAGLTVVYSVETPHMPVMPTPDPDMKANAPASVPFVPGAFGLALASKAIEILLNSMENTHDY
ncbi:MAG: ThiF family adenylyltransferase [Christensenellaceae bacterium]|nr:ThiF family adenylyltransferase [Christensenellaceae bacterium]